MSAIMDIKCVLYHKAFSAFCEKFHIPEEVHHVLPNRDNTIHELPIGNIGLYTRLYLMRRSLKVLRKFHWMIPGGGFNQLSHVCSPLLSKPGEY
nr:hypothetical protein [Tanacetum cinerariifolium]